MSVLVTNTDMAFELASRWQQGTPGGYLQGALTLPPSCSHLTLSTSSSSSAPAPHHLHLPVFEGRSRAKHLQCRSSCPPSCSLVFLDTEHLMVDWGREVELEVVGEQVVRGGRVVARVEWEEGRRVVRLGKREGQLRVAVLQRNTKQEEAGRKRALQAAVLETRVRATFITPGGQVGAGPSQPD